MAWITLNKECLPQCSGQNAHAPGCPVVSGGIAISSFSGPWAMFSNFYPCTVVLDGDAYPSVEHAYQAAKTLVRRERLGILSARKPGTAKALGQKVTLRDGWDEMKIAVMELLLSQKFTVETFAGTKLMATGERVLIEGNWWGDTFWGCVKNKNNGAWIGSNHLGVLLMKHREILIQQRERNKKS